ncbi:MAG: ABC transporter ATP-binding protein [Proteobacteria bacterium]|nr:ABC transporter ATP-binding protein [Pseudomonadota bacterium]
MSTELAVEFRSVAKRYGAINAVDGVSFSIEKGRLVTLLGPSGCGKTSTLRLIAGLDQPSEGTILINGIDVTHVSATDRDVSMVFQSYALFPHMTVLKNVAYGLVSSGKRRREAEAQARETLTLVGLSGLEHRLPSELSGGQQQRVAVARAIVLEPAVLLFDEPLSNLDARLRRHVRDEIRDLQQRLGLTAVYVTHDQVEALAVSDRIIVMDRGRIAQQGSPEELYRRPANRFIAGFMGEANVVSAELKRLNGIEATVRLGTLSLTLPHHGADDGPVEIAIRPEAIHLQPAPPNKEATMSGEILRARFLGDHAEYTVASALGDLFVVDPRVEALIEVGRTVALAFEARGMAVLPTHA